MTRVQQKYVRDVLKSSVASAGLTLLPDRVRGRKIWPARAGEHAAVASRVVDLLAVFKRRGRTVAVCVELEKSTGTNAAALAGKVVPAMPGIEIFTYARQAMPPAPEKRGRGRPRKRGKLVPRRRDFGATVFVVFDPKVAKLARQQSALAAPGRSVVVRVPPGVLNAASLRRISHVMVATADRVLPA
jgi:hypothetical protein